MFYVKERINDSMEITIEINDENVFCRCPHCGKEMIVDLAEVFKDEDADLCGTSIICETCTKKMREGM